MLSVEPVLAHLDRDFDQAVERLCDLLRIRSVGTDPAYKDDTRQAAQWLADQLAGMGFEASLRETPGHPMVVAHHPGPGGDGPHVLYYGHYDVQPADPMELWHSPPFEPTMVECQTERDRGARGRGRQGPGDDLHRGVPRVARGPWNPAGPITVLLEGEEETGSPNLVAVPRSQQGRTGRRHLPRDRHQQLEHRDAGDHLHAARHALPGSTLHGPSHDLHSGMYGGAVLNPINALTRILGQIHDDQGRVQFPGFYDDVLDRCPTREREQWRGPRFDEEQFLAESA